MSYLEKRLTEQGYRHIRQLPNGEWAGVLPLVFTWGLFVGLDEYTWRTRFCFDTEAEAATSLLSWDGTGFPPGYWIKQKPEEIRNPNRVE